MPSDAVLDTTLFVRHELAAAVRRNTQFIGSLANAGRLASNLLVYDRVWIPTKDMAAAVGLVKWCGRDLALEMLRERAVGFVHVPSVLAYAGNGGGLTTFRIGEGGRPFEWWQAALFGDPQTALELQLKNLAPDLASRHMRQIQGSVWPALRPLDPEPGEMDRAVLHESYMDVDRTPRLREFVLDLAGAKGSSVDLKRLPGIGPNQVQVAGWDGEPTAIQILLRVAQLNEELHCAWRVGGCDVTLPEGSADVIRNKLVRHGVAPSALGAFGTLLELAAAPDITLGVANGTVAIADVWKVRQSQEGRRFRTWLRAAGVTDGVELQRAYVAALQRVPAVASLPARAMRLIVTTLIGMAGVIPGIAAGAADSFFAEQWLGGYSPRLFMDRLRTLPKAGIA